MDNNGGKDIIVGCLLYNTVEIVKYSFNSFKLEELWKICVIFRILSDTTALNWFKNPRLGS